jgi:tetratricopeptide (TPR) repeat protein
VIQAHLGHPYFVKRDFKQALAHFQESLVLEPRQYWAYYNIGCVYEELGDFAQAVRYFERGDLEAGRNPDTTKQLYADRLKAFQQRSTNGYWSRRLEDAMRDAPDCAHDIAIALAHLDRTVEAYDWLKKAADVGQLNGLWYDLCWDHHNKRFREIAKQVGLKP